jgi:DNA-binding MarR family transcriptional regulator
MNIATDPIATDVAQRYRDNFPRQLLAIALHMQSQTMRTLIEERNHRGLKISFEPYISLVAEGGARLSDIADCLGITRQAANQTANQIEQAGYISRRTDPEDKRAKRIELTAQGRRLRDDGLDVIRQLQRDFQSVIGSTALNQTLDNLYALASELVSPIGAPSHQENPTAQLGALLPRLSDYVRQRLMALTMELGHPGLKLSFSQVLTQIPPRGGRMQQMAHNQGVSKQAINAVATELEQLGYIQRHSDPNDARQVLLHFTTAGHQLIADSVTAIDALESEFQQVIGARKLNHLKASFRQLYTGLHLESQFHGTVETVDVRNLSTQLLAELGATEARRLAHFLLAATDDERL